MEEWFFPRGVQPNCYFFSKEYNQESKQIEDLAPERAIISNGDPEGAISTMVVIIPIGIPPLTRNSMASEI